ncbi:ATP-binding protein [Frankia sp. B2]|uniref:AAA family ATPase n=1 Tax=Frankia sp. B2 TaxID=2541730 RepID=UPI00106C59AF|nr:AAA family ATPase [Frankia sp. B2]TFE26220.1 ATP-binding protein [Frankia sp. B2]
MIVQLAGLPGTGKSTLATELGRHLPAAVLSKDHIRHALFTNPYLTYSPAQDDLCIDVAHQAAAHLIDEGIAPAVVLDGPTCHRAGQISRVAHLADRLGRPLHVIECVCPPAVAHARLTQDQAEGTHPAADRTVALYQRIRANAVPIPEPKIVLATDTELAAVVARCLDRLGVTSRTAPS